MEDYDGFLKFSKKIQKTKILPLRWIGNFCGGLAGDHILMASYLEEDNSVGLHYRYHAKMYKILNKPYQWWGTYYIVDMDAVKKAWKEIVTDSESQDS
jgi:hypothetical protein